MFLSKCDRDKNFHVARYILEVFFFVHCHHFCYMIIYHSLLKSILELYFICIESWFGSNVTKILKTGLLLTCLDTWDFPQVSKSLWWWWRQWWWRWWVVTDDDGDDGVNDTNDCANDGSDDGNDQLVAGHQPASPIPTSFKTSQWHLCFWLEILVMINCDADVNDVNTWPLS